MHQRMRALSIVLGAENQGTLLGYGHYRFTDTRTVSPLLQQRYLTTQRCDFIMSPSTAALAASGTVLEFERAIFVVSATDGPMR